MKTRKLIYFILFAVVFSVLFLLGSGPIMAQFTQKQMLLYRAIMTNDITTTDSLTSADGFDVNEVFQQGVPLLHLACMEGKLEIAEMLVSKGADVELKDIMGNTPAKAAILRGNPNLLEFLINKGISINTVDDDGKNLLLYLLKYGQKNQNKLSEILINNGIKLNIADKSGKTALVYAIENRSEDVALNLINNGAELNWFDEKTGMNLLHYCAIYGAPQATKKLIEKGLDINAKDNLSTYPIIYALKYRHNNVAELLNKSTLDNNLVSELKNKSPFEDNLFNGQAIFWNLNHRGWAIKTKSKLLVFDYEEMGNKPGKQSILNGWLTPEELKEQSVISLYTCWHGYENEGSPMHNMDGKIKNIQYILNNDDAYKGKDSYKKMTPNETLTIDNFEITTFRSDGMTLGYLINGDGLKILYTGFPDTDNIEKNLSDLKTKVGEIDVLMLSTIGLDSDKEQVKKWADYLITNFKPQYIIPKDNKGSEELYYNFRSSVFHLYPEVKWYIAKYPGDRRHIK